MEKLELKNIAPYLPYNIRLKFVSKHNIDKLSKEDIVYLNQINEGFICVNGYKTNNKSYLPILRPLDLTKEIEHNGEKFVPLYELIKEDKAFTLDFIECYGIEELKLSVYEKLLEWHFDIFGLIEKGLAIDINTL